MTQDNDGDTRLGDRHLAAMAGIWALILLLFRETTRTIVDLWVASDTYTHAFLVLPIVIWLVWRRRPHLHGLPVRSSPVMLLPLSVACMAWLVAEAATVGVVAHFALAAVLVLSVPALLGVTVARALLFPLAFVFFAVPFGDAAVPTLMNWTADFTVGALRLTGIPVYREGLQFVIPSGTWSVVQACSGVRYLIASFMVGTLFAYLSFSSLRKRAAFIGASLLVPIAANWVRAYLIVMIGHLSNNQLAAGVDHLIYGWAFFGVVVGLMFWIGGHFADQPDGPVRQQGQIDTASSWSTWSTVATLTLLLVLTQVLHWRSLPEYQGELKLALPAGDSTWVGEDAASLPWSPGFIDPNASAHRRYRTGGQAVDLWVGFYRQQDARRKLVSSFNHVVQPEDEDWIATATGRHFVDAGLPGFRTTDLRKGGALGSQSAQRWRVWQVYWIGGRWIERDIEAKVWQAVDRLLGRGDNGAVVLMATRAGDGADAVLEKFARARLDPVGQVLVSARDTH